MSSSKPVNTEYFTRGKYGELVHMERDEDGNSAPKKLDARQTELSYYFRELHKERARKKLQMDVSRCIRTAIPRQPSIDEVREQPRAEPSSVYTFQEYSFIYDDFASLLGVEGPQDQFISPYEAFLLQTLWGMSGGVM